MKFKLLYPWYIALVLLTLWCACLFAGEWISWWATSFIWKD